ncbi:hypothetical protein D9M71_125400 [compost metagenome]
MTRLTIQAGDFLQGEGEYTDGAITLRTLKNPQQGEKITLNRIKEMTIANQESSRSLGSTLGWGMAGALVAGPIGMIAGMWLGGKEEEVTFVAKLKDGRKLMAITDAKTYTKLSRALKKQA